jgi:HlyD family secretion protein
MEEDMTRNRTIGIFAGVVLLVLSLGFVAARENAKPAPQASIASAAPVDTVAAPGRVEPISEEIKVAAEMSGKLASVAVEEGDRVEARQLLAVLENDDYRARVLSAEADLARREAELRRVINGARDQERREAAAEVKAAEAVLENARVEHVRRVTGYRDGVFAKEEADRAEREFGVAQARYEAALERHRLIDDEAREEDRARAEAEVRAAHARIDEARAVYEKTFIRAPIRGVILRKHLKAGESVSDQRDTPIVTMADVSTLRVRVDVDETDVGKVRVGQRAYVTADAYPQQKFWGRVVRVGRILGRKNVRTDEPSERVDTKILETLIELEGAPALPVGLRVDAYLLVNE